MECSILIVKQEIVLGILSRTYQVCSMEIEGRGFLTQYDIVIYTARESQSCDF